MKIFGRWMIACAVLACGFVAACEQESTGMAGDPAGVGGVEEAAGPVPMVTPMSFFEPGQPGDRFVRRIDHCRDAESFWDGFGKYYPTVSWVEKCREKDPARLAALLKRVAAERQAATDEEGTIFAADHKERRIRTLKESIASTGIFPTDQKLERYGLRWEDLRFRLEDLR